MPKISGSALTTIQRRSLFPNPKKISASPCVLLILPEPIGARHRRAPTTCGKARGPHEAVFRRRPASASQTARARKCRGDPVGRQLGAARALGPRWLVRGRGAQRCQGDAPRRPYMPCVQPRALRLRTWHRDGGVRCRGGSRPPTTRANPRGSPNPHATGRQCSIHPHPALRAGLSLAGRGVSLLLRWKQAPAFCPLTRPTCALPLDNVGATRWVAHWVPWTPGSGVAFCGTVAHKCTRATRRVAPTCRAYSRVRWASGHRKHLAALVVGAVREPPLQLAVLHWNPSWNGPERGVSPAFAPAVTQSAPAHGTAVPLHHAAMRVARVRANRKPTVCLTVGRRSIEAPWSRHSRTTNPGEWQRLAATLAVA